MGARQSKRSVDITTTPKKDGLPAEGSVAGDAAAPGDGKLERIEESDGKPTTNGTAPHSDAVVDDKDKEKEKEKEKEQDKDKENDKDKDEDTEKEEVKVEDTRQESSNTDTPAVAEEATTPTDGNTTPISPESATSPDSKDAKKKDKKKKWSLRSLSFGKKDRSKTAREDAPKNGDVTKEEPLAEGGEEAEVAAAVEESPAEEKTEVSSPTVESTPAVAPAPVKEEEKAAPASPTPVEEKKEEPTPAPTPVPVEEKKEEIEKVEPVVVADKVEVSPVQAIPVVGVTQAQPVTTPSIIERKTSEDLPPPLPSSPPPTPIDPSPLQQAQHAAANASALAEALKVPAEAASMASQIAKEQVEHAESLAESKTTVVTESNIVEAKLTSESHPVTVGQPVTEVLDSLKETEIPPVVDEDQSLPVASCSQIVAEVVKSVESEVIPGQAVSDVLIEQVDNSSGCDEKVDVCSKSLETQEIVVNGVSGLHSLSWESLTSPAKNAPDTGKIEVSVVPDIDLIYDESSFVIQSEEGPLPLFKESLVEAKPAHVVPEDDFTQSVIKAVETIDLLESERKSETIDVVLETDKVLLNESDSNVLLAENVKTNSTDIKSSDAIQTESVSVVPTMNSLVNEIVPPLPESPIPSLEKSQGMGELLSEKVDESMNHLTGGSFVSPKTMMNDLSGQLDSEDVFDPIEELRACHMSAEGLVSPFKDTLQELSSSVTDTLNLSESSPPLLKLASPINEVLPEFLSCPKLVKEISSTADDFPVPPNEFDASDDPVMICPIPTKNFSSPVQDIPELTNDPEICSMISKATNDPELIIENSSPAEEPLSPKIPAEKVVSSSPSCPSPTNILISPKESSHFELNDEQSNQEFEVESLSQSLNSYNDSDVQLKERLAESEGMNGLENSPSCPLLKAVPTAVPENAQKIAEPEAPAENPAEVSATESVTEAPASPAPPVPAELPVLPPSEPALTEDVASVTKAIEDFEISDKAVAAAVNEAIDSNNANEIVNDSLHQKVITE